MAVRIAGVTIPNDKRIVIALPYIYGVGKPMAKDVLKAVGVSEEIRTKDLTEDQVNLIRTELEKRAVRMEGELRRDLLSNIKRLKDIGSYRGSRHMKRLPVRGQRSKTNSRTIRGNARKTMGSGKRILTKT